ncbi:unnamed protein product [Diatraea saccharalis]|uniref:Uncharacterized protein n=1 Tax=Diatraea saccharalis TaxID=40085 RepID=A0A9N9RB55_9NEOP|nr:unnamed protein product [Diatraea saccharalis]
MTEREHRSAKRKWKTANKKRRERQKTALQIRDITPTSSQRSGTPVLPRPRGRKQIRRDRSAISDDEFLASYSQPSVSNIKERQLIEKENIHPTKISDGVHVLVKVSSAKDKHYTYLGVAKSEVDEEGDVKIMFYKTVDKTGKRFKAVDTDISYEPYDNILEIVPNPKIVVKAVPALSYLDLSLAAVAFASDLTVSVADRVEVVLKDSVVENVEENDEPRPKPNVVRYRRRYIFTDVCTRREHARDWESCVGAAAGGQPGKAATIYYSTGRKPHHRPPLIKTPALF